jgi:aldose 1-epimerase
MFIIKHTNLSNKNLNYIEIEDIQKTYYAKIYLNLGGSLQELVLNNYRLIKDLSPLTYENTYASSILFPFANRIADGVYEFEEKEYCIDINQEDENNALHGLVYNKTFEILEQKTTNEKAVVVLRYVEQKPVQGFPYTYTIDLKYTLTKDNLNLSVSVKNTNTKTFPFTIGWHPYFNSQDLYESSVYFQSNKSVVSDKRNITLGLKHLEVVYECKIENKILDDCFVLDSDEILFKTPEYSFVLSSSEKDCFLQLYTPPHDNTIAIEPTTGISNSFNNGIGLKTLKPNDVYRIHWNLKIN